MTSQPDAIAYPLPTPTPKVAALLSEGGSRDRLPRIWFARISDFRTIDLD